MHAEFLIVWNILVAEKSVLWRPCICCSFHAFNTTVTPMRSCCAATWSRSGKKCSVNGLPCPLTVVLQGTRKIVARLKQENMFCMSCRAQLQSWLRQRVSSECSGEDSWLPSSIGARGRVYGAGSWFRSAFYRFYDVCGDGSYFGCDCCPRPFQLVPVRSPWTSKFLLPFHILRWPMQASP